jgi:hypothetical protein
LPLPIFPSLTSLLLPLEASLLFSVLARDLIALSLFLHGDVPGQRPGLLRQPLHFLARLRRRLGQLQRPAQPLYGIKPHSELLLGFAGRRKLRPGGTQLCLDALVNARLKCRVSCDSRRLLGATVVTAGKAHVDDRLVSCSGHGFTVRRDGRQPLQR